MLTITIVIYCCFNHIIIDTSKLDFFIIFFKKTICVIVAEIKKLNENKFGWTYEGCKFCNLSVRMDNGKLMCNRKHINEKPIIRYSLIIFPTLSFFQLKNKAHIVSFNQISSRYRVDVQAVHKDDKAKFLLWDSHVTSCYIFCWNVCWRFEGGNDKG